MISIPQLNTKTLAIRPRLLSLSRSTALFQKAKTYCKHQIKQRLIYCKHKNCLLYSRYRSRMPVHNPISQSIAQNPSSLLYLTILKAKRSTETAERCIQALQQQINACVSLSCPFPYLRRKYGERLCLSRSR